MHYIIKVNIVLGNFGLHSVYADWAPTIKSLKATGLVEADKLPPLYNGVCSYGRDS